MKIKLGTIMLAAFAALAISLGGCDDGGSSSGGGSDDVGDGGGCNITCDQRTGTANVTDAFVSGSMVTVDGTSPTGGAFGFQFDPNAVDANNNVYFNSDTSLTHGNEIYNTSASKGQFSSQYQCSDVVISLEAGWGTNSGDTISGTITGELYTETTSYCRSYDFSFSVTVTDGGGTPPGGMALIPSGCFDMGDAFGEGDSDELPLHNVCITSDFYMDVHEVTNAEYAACVSGGGCTAPGNSGSVSRGSYYGNPTYDNFPVLYVDWYQAVDYCAWAGKRLPTEAEWEYAARGGLSGKRYPWGDAISGTDANYWGSGDPWDNDTSEVEYYAANGYGLYDMAGNVWEWTNDWYSSTYYSSSPTNDPPGPASGTYRVLRGGGWNFAGPLRVADRDYFSPYNQFYAFGFRCAGD